jgi:hypothetical protein
MKERPAIFLLKVLGLSLFLYLLWNWKGEGYYLPILEDLLKNLSWALGIRRGGVPFPKYILSNLIPFISFMLITKDLKLMGRISKLIIGLLILSGGHILLGIAVYLLCQGLPTPETWCYKLSILLYTFNGILPFLLWVILAKRNLLNLFIPKKVLTAK